MITEESNSKQLRRGRGRRRRRRINDDGIDSISTLPISLLCHILSFLPTKTSVSTMTLVSRIWRNLWKDLQVFDFSYNDCYPFDDDEDQEEQFKLFTVFVNTVLSFRNSRDIRKFSLSSDYFDSHDTFNTNSVESWVRTASGPHLQEFDLHLPYEAIDVPLTLPLPLFSCSNLVSLCLSGHISLQLQDSSGICLPSLKVLKLEDICCLNVNSANILFCACPILETLELSFNADSLATLRVPSSLKRLKICVLNDFGAFDIEVGLEIDAPSLKYLRLTDVSFWNAAAFGNLHNVEKAYLDIFSNPESNSVEPLLNLLRALSGIKHLELECSTIERLYAAPILDIPEFCNLCHLEVNLPSFNSSFMCDLLHKCPMLQNLIAIHEECDDSPPSYEWAEKPKSVPNCLISHLTFIRFRQYEGQLPEEFTSYVLQNALVLKTLFISDCNLSEDLKKKIWDLPRGSAMCQVTFDPVSP